MAATSPSAKYSGFTLAPRGGPYMYTHLMFGILVIAAEQILRLLN
jgi:hypothetical protein